jgi:hypothetical protein
MHRIKMLIEGAKYLTIIFIFGYILLLTLSLHLQGFELKIYNTNEYFLTSLYFKSIANLIGAAACVVAIVYLVRNPSENIKDDSLITSLLLGITIGLGTSLLVALLAYVPTTRFEVVRVYSNPVIVQTSLKALKVQEPISYARGRVHITDEHIEAQYDDQIKDKYVRLQSRTLRSGELISKLQVEHLLIGDKKAYFDLRNIDSKVYDSLMPFAIIWVSMFLCELAFLKPTKEKKPT